VRVT
jgi:hypothetical protein